MKEFQEVRLDIVKNGDSENNLEWPKDSIAFYTFILHIIFGGILIVALGYHILNDDNAIELRLKIARSVLSEYDGQ